MRRNRGLLRFVEIEEFGRWIPWCICYKDFVIDNVLMYRHNGGSAACIKYRFRLAGSDKWHIAFV